MNMVVLVGKVKKITKKTEDQLLIDVEVKRDFGGGSDILEITLWSGIAQMVFMNVKLNDSISVNGRLEMNDGTLSIIGHKITIIK